MNLYEYYDPERADGSEVKRKSKILFWSCQCGWWGRKKKELYQHIREHLNITK